MSVTQTMPTTNTVQETKVQKMLFILSKATIENVYAAFIMANGARMEGIESEIFFTFFGLEAIQKKKLNDLRVATVGNPAMHIPTMLGGLPGMEALATKMMKKEMEKLDMPPVDEFLEILSDSGCKLWACKLAVEMFKLTPEDMIDEIDGIITVGDFYSRANQENTHLLFI
ncbi:MAG: DsrE/DsrF/DrsH-like family protein [Polaribacter sp.]|jgi:peroxiredoxin family protein